MQKQTEDSKSVIFEKLLLFFILAATFILCLKQMYPFRSFDEAELLNWAAGFHNEAFPVMKYPTSFLYLHYLLSGLYGTVLSFLGVIKSSSGFLASDFGFRFTMEAGRIVSAIFGTLTVYFSFKIGKEFYNKHTGFAAAVLMACNNLVILYSHIVKPDIQVTLLVTITLYFILKYLRTAKPIDIFFSALFYGLAVAVKFNALPIILAIILAFLLTLKKNNHRKTIKKGFIFLPLGAAVGFFGGAPNWLIRPVGNLKMFFSQYSPEDGGIYQPYDLQSPLETYSQTAAGIVDYFGLIFLVFLIAAVLIGFLTVNKRDMVISTVVILYIVFFGLFGFYAHRYVLPVFPAAALLMAKFLFNDLRKLFRRFGKNRPMQELWRCIVPLLWLPVAVYAIHYTIINVKSFNLLKTQSQWDRTLEYREQHNLPDGRFNIGRQFFTPRIRGNNIKIKRRFQLKFPKKDGNKTLHFVQAHLPTYDRFMAMTAEEKKEKNPDAVNLTHHKPFYRIKKREYQPWNPECIYLYRIPPQLSKIRPLQRQVNFPRTFYKSSDTSFLPLQIYEKNPNFGKSARGIYKHWLYSQKEIKKIKIFLFSLQKNYHLNININGTRKVFKKQYRERAPVEVIEIENLRPKRFYYDYVYAVEIWPGGEQPRWKPYYFVFYPVYAGAGAEHEPGNKKRKKRGVFLASPRAKEIPGLFSNQPLPRWVKSVYRQTGMDLSLLTFLSTHSLYKNSHKTVGDFSIDFVPLEKGRYILRLEGGKIIAAHPPGSAASLECTFYSIKGIRKERLWLTLTGEKLLAGLPLDVKDPPSFVKIDVKGLRENNYLINRVTLTPDYRHFFSSNPIRK